jgi:hypothetical protein
MSPNNHGRSSQHQESETQRTHIEDLAPEGYCLSEEDLQLVSGGRISKKVPADDDATHIGKYLD